MRIFDEAYLNAKYQLFIQRLPRASGHTSYEQFKQIVKVILFNSSKQAEHQFFMSDKTIKKIKDLLREDVFEE